MATASVASAWPGRAATPAQQRAASAAQNIRVRLQALTTGLAGPAGRSAAAAPATRARAAASQSSDSEAADKQLLVVVAAVLLNDEGKVLLARRPSGKTREGRWELPGGHVDDGESCEEALSRELQEELGITVQQQALRPLTFVSDPAQGPGTAHLLLPAFVCDEWEGMPAGAEGQKLAWMGEQELAAARHRLLYATRMLAPALVGAMRRHRRRREAVAARAAAAAAAGGAAEAAEATDSEA
ncbi:hypothetical protein ABPG75_004358 [Micractinium tetrahymenae]